MIEFAEIYKIKKQELSMSGFDPHLVATMQQDREAQSGKIDITVYCDNRCERATFVAFGC